MKPTHVSVESHVQSLPASKQTDVQHLLELFKEITEVHPKMWGTIIGYGHVTYQYASGHQGEMPVISFAARQKALTLYLNCDLSRYDLSPLGPTTQGVGCLYIKHLDMINRDALKTLIKSVIDDVQSMESVQTIIQPVILS